MPQGAFNNAIFVSNILRDVFGIQSPVYVANAWIEQNGFVPSDYNTPKQQRAVFPDYENIRLLPEQEGEETSILGTPVFGSITFDGGSYNRYNRRTGEVEKGEYGTYTLPYSCLADFSRENNVITTPVLGGNGTVKEVYGIGDWDITIRGIAFNNDGYGDSAHQVIRKVVEWSQIADAFNVSGSVFYGKNIFRIVVKSIDIQPLEAKWNVIPFQIRAISDEDIKLTL
jgi:hypothetical protein